MLLVSVPRQDNTAGADPGRCGAGDRDVQGEGVDECHRDEEQHRAPGEAHGHPGHCLHGAGSKEGTTSQR